MELFSVIIKKKIFDQIPTVTDYDLMIVIEMGCCCLTIDDGLSISIKQPIMS